MGWQDAPEVALEPIEAAHQQLNLNTQERNLYQRHLDNLNGPGKVMNQDGSISTLFQMSIGGGNGKTYNIPSVYDGKILEPDEAISRAKSIGLDTFPSYGSEQEAESRYEQMHHFMDQDVGRYRNQPAWMKAPEVTGTAEPPSTLAVAGNAAAKGVAGLGDMFLNAPVNAYNVAKAGAVLAGDAVGTDLRDTLTETPQPNLIQKGFEKVGLIRPENEPQTPGQRILDMAVQSGVGMAVNPGAGAIGAAKGVGLGLASGAAAGVTKEATGSDLAATAVGMATPLAAHGVMASKANAPLLKNPTKLDTAKEGMAAGYVVPPSHLKPSFSTNRIESVAGKAAIEQQAAARNQEVTNKLAAKSLGLKEDTIIDDDVLDAVRTQAGQVYEKLKAVLPGGELRGLKVRTIEDRPMVEGPITGMTVKTSQDRPMLPGPSTGLNVKRTEGPSPVTGLNVGEIRDAEGRLIGLKTRQTSEGTQGPLEGLRVTETSRGQDIPGRLEGMTVSHEVRHGADVPGGLQGLKVKVEQTKGGSPVDELKQVRADAKVYFRHNRISGDPKSLTKANGLMTRATELEDQLEQAAIKSGNPELIKEFRDARTQIAKTYVIEKALNRGDGNINAHKIAAMVQKKEPLTGELEIIGKFANAFRKETRPASAVPSPGVSGTDAAASALLGTVGYGATGGPFGLVAAGLPLLRGPARALLLSKGYQNRLLKEPPQLNQAMLQSILGGRAIAEAP